MIVAPLGLVVDFSDFNDRIDLAENVNPVNEVTPVNGCLGATGTTPMDWHSPEFFHRLEQRQQVVYWRFGDDVVDGVEDEAAAFTEDADTLLDLGADLFRCAERQCLLRVHAATPEGDLLAVLALQLARIHAGGGALHGVEDVEASLDDLRD